MKEEIGKIGDSPEPKLGGVVLVPVPTQTKDDQVYWMIALLALVVLLLLRRVIRLEAGNE